MQEQITASPNYLAFMEKERSFATTLLENSRCRTIHAVAARISFGLTQAIKSRVVHLTPEELLSVLRTARSRSSRDWPMILLVYPHRPQASEAGDLKMTDADLGAGSLSTRRLKGSLHSVQPLYRHKGQPLVNEIAALRAWPREREPDGSDYLFLTQKGGKLHWSRFFRVFQDRSETAGPPL
jgi:integrase